MVPSAAMTRARTRLGTQLALLLAPLLLLLVALPAHAADETDAPSWDLVTVGPDTDLFSLWGHSALCVSTKSFEDGWCYDFGVAREHDPFRLALGTLRGHALFGVVKLPAGLLLRFYGLRDTWRQRLDLDPVQGRRLLIELEALTQQGKRYAYQPLFRNCTTEIRDRLDLALSGRLSSGAAVHSGPPLRFAAEAGMSGHVLPLVLTELAGGSVLHRPSSAWERMALPHGLMQAVSERLSMAPSRMFTRVDTPPPTSPSAGRIVLVLWTALGSLAFWLLVRRFPRAKIAFEVALVVWLVFLSLLPLIGTMSTLPSLHRSWMLLVLTPLDAVLLAGGKNAEWPRPYLGTRLLTLLAAGVLSLTGVIAQPLWVGIIVAGAPLALLARSRYGWR